MPEEFGCFRGFKKRIQGHRTGLPDLRFIIEDVIADGDNVAFRWSMQGTNSGSYLGRPPSGKKVNVTGMNMERLVNWSIVDHWSNPDLLALMKQLGTITM